MSCTANSFLSGILVVSLFSLCAGCLSTGVGDTWYSNNSVMVNISHTGDPSDVSVQVTVYRITNLTQEKDTIVSTPVTMVNGENTVAIPLRLEPGSYKLYVYVLGNGDRKAAVIRDIVV
jgi:hypothetical protein